MERDFLDEIQPNLFCWKLFPAPPRSSKSTNRTHTHAGRVAIQPSSPVCKVPGARTARAFNRLKPAHVPISTNAPRARPHERQSGTDSKRSFQRSIHDFLWLPQSYQGNNFRQRRNQWQKVELAAWQSLFRFSFADTDRQREREETRADFDSHTYSLLSHREPRDITKNQYAIYKRSAGDFFYFSIEIRAGHCHLEGHAHPKPYILRRCLQNGTRRRLLISISGALGLSRLIILDVMLRYAQMSSLRLASTAFLAAAHALFEAGATD